MQPVHRVGIFSKPHTEAAHQIVPQLISWLSERGIQCHLDEETARYAQTGNGLPRHDVPIDCQLIVVLGGDGTVLSAARAVGHREIPIFAVNLGKLGFLTAITVDDLFSELDRTISGEGKTSRRRTMCVGVKRNGRFMCSYDALNDVVVTNSSIARMIEVDVYVNTHMMCSYRADGLIVATPTGSTAYSLAANGPIVFPTVEAICITPICPHTLTNRPVIVPSNVVITVINRAHDESAFLTVDGQVGEPLHEGDELECRTTDYVVNLVRQPQKSFFDVLRQKLKWGDR